MKHPITLAMAILAVILAACGAPASTPATATTNASDSSATATLAASPSPSTSATARTLDGRPMDPCVLSRTTALCGTLTVPEDRDNPAGREIQLRVMVVPARAAQPAPDPVFFLAGGPGGAATASFAWATSTFSSLNQSRDFVMVDQRGTGGSNRLVVPDGPDLDGIEEADREAAIQDWLATTLAEMAGDPRFYTTSVAMDDLDAVREALGYDLINLYGPSYGATAAQYYLRQHEDHVRSVVLDGATLLDVPVFERIAVNTQRALDLLFDRCQVDPDCAGAFPDLRSEFPVIRERLDAESVSTSVVDPQSGDPIVIDAISFASAVHSALLSADVSSQVPALLHAAYLEDWETVARASLGIAGQNPPSDPLVMSAVIRCSEAWARYDPAEVERLGAGTFELEAQLANARAQAESCRFTPVGIVPANDAEPVRSDVPILLTVGEADPQDPPANVADAPIELPNSLTVVVPGMGHTVGHLGCMPSIVVAFIEAGSVAGLDVSCAATGVPLPPFRTTN